ncbi:MAG: DUF3784 domain-containing protein [Bacteroidota bacterium]|nr:DUF3784 domain-containing protein [Bacteroidota bacterium]
MIYVVLGLGVLFVGLGYLITEKNADILLSGYNTMSKEEQEQFPLTEYLKCFKGFHLRFGIVFSLIGAAFYLTNEELLGWHLGITPILAYIYFFYQVRELYTKMESQKNSFKIGIIILIATLAFLIGMFFWSERPSIVELDDQTLKISGPYGIELPLEQIDSLGISNTLPVINKRKHGFSTAAVAKGKYKGLEGHYLLLIDKPYNKVLWVGRKSGDPILISLKELDEEKLFRELKESLKLDTF